MPSARAAFFMSERKLQAIKYNPGRTSEEVRQDTQDYIDIKEKGSIPGRPEVTPHHIRGLRDYENAFDHLTPENQDLIQKELAPYGLSLGDGKANLQGAEGRFSRSRPGRTSTMGKGGLHQKLHEEQRIAAQKLGLDKSHRTFTGVAGTPWSKMSQEDIMAFIRASAISDEMTVNRTIGQFYGLPSLPPIEKIKNQVQQRIFGNRLTGTVDTLDTMLQMQGSSLEEAVEASRKTSARREEAAKIAREKGGLFGMPDLGISEAMSGKSFINDERQKVLRRHLL